MDRQATHHRGVGTIGRTKRGSHQPARRRGYGQNILIIAGFGRHDACLEAEINRLAEFPNVAVLTETIANIKGSRLIAAVDRTLLAMDSDKKFVPDLLITIGGALVSRMVKAFMRQNKPAAHWHVGVTGTTVDCMQALTRRILADPAVFSDRRATACGAAQADMHAYGPTLRRQGLTATTNISTASDGAI